MSSALSVGSLFSGIGGLELGLERAGMVVKWQVENEPYCLKVLDTHWPDVTRYTDVREVGAHNLKPVDLICGGFPCQPHSLAGKRGGEEDPRDLWPQFARIIRELRPRWVLAENVPGLLSSDNGRFFGNVLRDLAASGYDAEWDCIPACAVGAPHRRYRVFIVAYAKNVFGNGRNYDTRVGMGRRSVPELGNNSSQAHVPNPHGREQGRGQQSERGPQERDPDVARHGQEGDVAHAEAARFAWGQRAERPGRAILDGCGQWAVEPAICRVANGVPSRVDRLRALGNAVVPQVAEWIGRRIVEADSSEPIGD